MELRYGADEQAFRLQVRAFLDAELPPATRDKTRLGRRLGEQLARYRCCRLLADIFLYSTRGRKQDG
jgi:hypothetical protein